MSVSEIRLDMSWVMEEGIFFSPFVSNLSVLR